MIDLLGHFAYVFLLGGTLIVGKKYRWGWLVRSLGSLGWIILGLYMGMTSIWIWSLFFFAADLNNWRQWREELPKAKPIRHGTPNIPIPDALLAAVTFEDSNANKDTKRQIEGTKPSEVCCGGNCHSFSEPTD